MPPAILHLFVFLALTALTLLALRRTLRVALLPAATLWIAAGLWSAQIQPTPSSQSALLRFADGLGRTIRGRIVRIRTLPARSVNHDSDVDPDQWDETAGAGENSTPSTSIDLDLIAIEEVTPDTTRLVPIAGGIRATLLANSTPQSQRQLHPQTPPLFRCGDIVEATLRLRVPERYRDPGAWQFADYLLDQGIAATANLPSTKLHLLPGPAHTHPLTDLSASAKCRIFAAQDWAANRLLAYSGSSANRRLLPWLRLTPDDAGMVNAMLFGDRSRLTQQLRLGFQRTGSFHLFVVSGMHVALLAGLLVWIAHRLRLRNWIATLLTVALTYAYALLTGFGVPVQRALLMTAVFLLARLIFRQHNSLNALGAAALAVLLWSPRALFEASFQMTFLAIVAIAGIAMPIGERSFLPYTRAARNLRYIWLDSAIPPRFAQFRVTLRMCGEPLTGLLGKWAYVLPARMVITALWVVQLMLIGLVAEAVMVLPMTLYFHRATVFALPANMICIPLIAVLASLGLATFLASLVSPWLTALPGSALALLLHGVTGAINRISHAQSADLRVPGPTIVPALLAVACFAFCCWAVRHRSRAYAWAAVVVLPLAAAIVLWPQPPAVHPGQLEVSAIDVGQGDSLLVVGPTGLAMLIDAGGPTGAAANAENASLTSSAFDVGEEVVSPYLWSRQFRRLDVVALTHAHSDHMGGMPAILRNFRPRELWVSVDPDSDSYRTLLTEAASLGIRVRHLRAGDHLNWDTLDLAVLAPTPAYTNPGPPINNDSLVLHLQFGRASALLEGDAEAPSEHQMVYASLINPAAQLGPDTLLKVGHHGSRTSTTPEFLALAAPQDAVISVGRNNTFGHPRPEIIQRLADAHARVFRTDQFGLTTFLLSRDGQIFALPAANP
ncbi:MAG TPA: ComEC/Rec2 family competence protein [Acidobacteriaceae bacterium]|nr:ComEC/Rec2 family competence protein [Acidobacteriaceae bacterium]